MTDPVQLARGEVHVWCVTLDVPPATSAGLYATIAEEERHRSARFRFERDRQRFVVAHGALRDLLGRYVRVHPGEIRFVCNAFGKPQLNPDCGSRLKFNLSHSAGCALIAIAADADIGVDLEYVRTQPDHAEIARHFFSEADVDRLNRLPSHVQAQAFLSCWTKNEAYGKACGKGLAGLQDAANDIAPARRWSLYTLQPAPGYIGALAIEGSGWHVSQRHWQGSGAARDADAPCSRVSQFAVMG